MRYCFSFVFSAFFVVVFLLFLTFMLSPSPMDGHYTGDRHPVSVRDAPMYDRDYRIPPVELLLHLEKRIKESDLAAIRLGLEIYSARYVEEFLITSAFEDRILSGIWTQIRLSKSVEKFYYQFCHGRLFEGLACRSGQPIICSWPPPLNLRYFRSTRQQLVTWAKKGSLYVPTAPRFSLTNK